ncbi:carbonate dehydratase, partial [Puccinia striiformis f. sp. tritici PST-78]
PEEPAPTTPTDKGEAAIAKWIKPIQTLAFNELEKKDEDFNLSKLITLNVECQVKNIINHEIIQKAWARGQPLSVHGWVYTLSSGKVQDLGLTQDKP